MKNNQSLRFDQGQLVEFYSILCDAVYRVETGLAEEDGFRHTSPQARKIALAIEKRLIAEGYIEQFEVRTYKDTNG